jgi:hypothetical protein
MTHAPEPLCQFCGEDRPAMVTKDERAAHCSTCGRSWPVKEK